MTAANLNRSTHVQLCRLNASLASDGGSKPSFSSSSFPSIGSDKPFMFDRVSLTNQGSRVNNSNNRRKKELIEYYRLWPIHTREYGSKIQDVTRVVTRQVKCQVLSLHHIVYHDQEETVPAIRIAVH